MLTITAGYRLVGGTIRLTKPTRPMRRHDNDRDLHLLIESRDAFVLFGYSVLKEDSMIKPRIMTFALREKENPKTALSTRPWSEGGPVSGRLLLSWKPPEELPSLITGNKPKLSNDRVSCLPSVGASRPPCSPLPLT